VIYSAKPQLTSALSPQAALDAASVLARKNSTRTFTGATGSERDAWTLRLGPSGATAIWIGFDKPSVVAPEKRLNALLEEFVKRLGNG
jgi:membrane carboxypeptidase/penicillin-binding protein